MSTPASDPASTTASASVLASVPVSTATPTPLSGTTEKKLELEEKKRARAAKTASPKTVFDGSSVLSTDGGIAVDYEEGEGTSSFPSIEFKPATGTRSAREEDSSASSSKRPLNVSDAVPSTLEARAFASDPPVVPSEQRDASRTDDSVRDPGCRLKVLFQHAMGARFLRTIVYDAEAASKHFEPMTNQGEISISRFSTSSDTGARRRLRGEAECLGGRHSVKAGINLLKTSTKTRQLIPIESLQLASAS
ncbi:hypothetical protein PHMEG_0006724 [Phytophthora megakarya]|uniref:Uncharacterized protein n=1 Tax=Phytophthora megakarya TaxID=4795 RepID=A0A225WN64_9STRA|nr:hypothetical protein PHMEG_0006724 [Phytophthora megakarya]